MPRIRLTLLCAAALSLVAISPGLSAQTEAPPVSIDPELLDLDDPASPISVAFPDLERLARPDGFLNVSDEELDLVVFRSGRQIYLYADVQGGAPSDEAERIATFYEHETDAGLPRGIRDALVDAGASQEQADAALGELEAYFQRPYRWQALCFQVGESIEMQGIAGVR